MTTTAELIARLTAQREGFTAPPPKAEDFVLFEDTEEYQEYIESKPAEVFEEVQQNIIDVAFEVIEDVAPAVLTGELVEVERIAPPATNDLIERARALTSSIDETYLELAKLCKTMIAENVPEQMGYTDNKQFFNEVIGLDSRKAYYFVSIARWISDNRVDEKKVSQIGWSKVKELVTAPVHKINELIELAPTVSTETLKDEIKRAKRVPGADPVASHKLNLKFFDDQWPGVENALVIAKNIYRTDSTPYALWRLLEDWSINQEGAPDRESLFRYVTSTYNVRIIDNE